MSVLRPERSDERLVAAYRAGDRAAFDAIHERYRARLERFARRLLGRGSEHAEDVVQEAALRATRALLRDDRPMQLKPWLFRIVRNCALDELSRVRPDPLQLDVAEAGGLLRTAPGSEPAAAYEDRSEACAQVRPALLEAADAHKRAPAAALRHRRTALRAAPSAGTCVGRIARRR